MSAKTHKISLAAALALFQAMGFKTADKWDAERATEKFAKLAGMLDKKGKFDPEELDPNDITDKKQRALFDELHEHLVDGITIEVEAPAEEAPAKKKVTEEEDEAPAKKKVTDEEDEAPAPKAKKAAASDDADDEKPAKKKKVGAKADTKVARDEFGSIVGSDNAKVNEALSKKPQTISELSKASGVKRVRYAHLNELVENKHAVKVDKEGVAAWKLR